MWHRLQLPAVGLLLLSLLAYRIWQSGHVPPRGHEHAAGAILSLADDRFHVEVVCTQDGWLKLYTLGSDERRVLEVESQTLTAHATPAGGSTALAVELRAAPQPGDAGGKTSCFSGRLPAELVARPLHVSVPNLRISGERFHLNIAPRPTEHLPPMPTSVGEDMERALYLTPGGAYTLADIAANGRQVPSRKYQGFQAHHDPNPKPGEPCCPITGTKAHPDCRWVIGGKRYLFCCPPCIDELVKLARTTPERVQNPEAYVKP